MPRETAPFTEADLRAAISRADCWAETLRLLGYSTRSGNYRTIQRWARNWTIQTDHFDGNRGRSRANRARAQPLAEVMVENSTYSRWKLKERLYATGIKRRVCEMCGQNEIWRGNRMSLILDHINGVSNDHRLENLRIVCPNCAAALDTHCGRNLPRHRTCPTCGARFEPRHIRHRFCSRACSGVAHGDEVRGVPKPEARKVQRPSYEQLRREVAETSMCAVGRKYGVSDNAVRKWLRAYEQSEALQRIEQRSARAEPSGGTH